MSFDDKIELVLSEISDLRIQDVSLDGDGNGIGPPSLSVGWIFLISSLEAHEVPIPIEKFKFSRA